MRQNLPVRHLVVSAAVAGLLALFLAGCDRSPTGGLDFRHNKSGKGTPVATFHKDSITAEDLAERFAEMSPFARARFQTADQRKEYLEGIARFELLAAEALARGLQNDPEVIETAKKVMVQKLIQKEFDEKGSPVSDEEVAAYYEKHRSDYVKPEMIRLSHIFVKAEGDPGARAEKKVQAESLVKQARALQPLDYAGFGQMVEDHSDDEKTKPLRGDMRYLSTEELAAQYGGEVAVAAQTLVNVGQVSEVVETPTGFHVLKLQGRQTALNLSVEQVKTQIQSRLLYERRTANFNKFIEGLKARAGYKVHDAPLAAMELDLKAPAREGKGSTPGFIPAASGGGQGPVR
jgi:peptidyl-prolyl cis-trans isomerase C